MSDHARRQMGANYGSSCHLNEHSLKSNLAIKHPIPLSLSPSLALLLYLLLLILVFVFKGTSVARVTFDASEQPYSHPSGTSLLLRYLSPSSPRPLPACPIALLPPCIHSVGVSQGRLTFSGSLALSPRPPQVHLTATEQKSERKTHCP